MKKYVIKSGYHFVGNNPINFGYTTLYRDIKDAKLFDTIDDASNYSEEIVFDITIESVELNESN